MDMTGTRRIAASREKVWAALNEPDILRQCIPGCEALERQSQTDMTAKVKLTVGPVKATFSGKVKLTDLNPPSGYKITGEGSGGMAGHGKGSAVVRLAEEGSATVMTYEVHADVGGKLAQLGGRLIDATAKKLADDFFEKFTTLVGGEVVADEPASAAGTPINKVGWLKRLLTTLGLVSPPAPQSGQPARPWPSGSRVRVE